MIAKRVTAATTPDRDMDSEVHVCSFLDRHYPSSAPHFVYAYYALDFTVPLLTRLYRQFIDTHSIDAIVLVDGGSDSIMAGDEQGLGDPIEDAVSITTVASLTGLKAKVLVVIGLGTDRFNHVSDAASLRTIAELTRMGGFLGSVSLEPTAPGSVFPTNAWSIFISDKASGRFSRVRSLRPWKAGLGGMRFLPCCRRE